MKDIKGFEGIYAITEDGQVWSYRSKKFLKPCISERGYLIVCLSIGGKHKNYRVNRLVAETYIPNPENKPEVNHLDENRANNHVNNLQWTTSSENKKHSPAIGKHKQFTKIRCVETGEIYDSCAAAARAVGVHTYCINCCVNGTQKTSAGYHWERVIEED